MNEGYPLLPAVLALIGVISAFLGIFSLIVKNIFKGTQDERKQAREDQKAHTKALLAQTSAANKQAASNQAVVKELKSFSKRQDQTGELLVALTHKIDINGTKEKP